MNPTINPAYAAALGDTTRNNTNSFAPAAQQTQHYAHDTNNESTAPVNDNDKSGDNQSIGSIGSWDDSDADAAVTKPSNYQANTTAAAAPLNATTTNAATSPNEAAAVPAAAAAAPSGATASYQNRNPVLPQWMYDNSTNAPSSTNTNTNSAPSTSSYNAAPQSYEHEPNPILHQHSAAPSNSTQSSSHNKSYYYQPHRPTASHHQYHNSNSSNSSYNNYYSQSLSSSHHHHPSSSNYSTHHSYSHHQHQPQYHHHHNNDNLIEIPPDHTPTWQHILPPDYFKKRKEQRYNNQYGRSRRKFILTLINLWEFTVTTESIDIYGSSTEEVFHGLRGPIKKIARDHIGKNGRKGAIFERGVGGEGIMPDDPSLRQATERLSNEDDGNNSSSATSNNNVGMGKWRIPLGAYQALFSYLTREGSVEGIAPEQLRVATLGRERADKKVYPSVKWLLDKGVSTVVAEALAPYQRGGVEFIIEKEGKALLADEMGLGKTIQAIAAMSAFRKDWPLLVLCPSTARYHWETEFRHWMGRESQSALTKKANGEANGNNNNKGHGSELLRHSQINVLTSGKDRILKADNSTKVVICSIGLIVNLVNSQRIFPGMFRATIVDESHVLKNKATKRTKAVLPLLEAAERCLLLSGTPALAKPSELWPQLSVLGGQREDGSRYPSGIMCDYEDFMSKYVRGQSKTRLAELHTLLTSTVMIRRMKVDMLKNLPPKIREKAFIKIEDQRLQSEFTFYLRMLKEGKGLLGKLARTHEIGDTFSGSQFVPENGDEPLKNKEVLHHLYNLSGRCKVARITKMLKNWLNDPTKGKLCIFAHHLYVLDELARGAGLSNFIEGMAKFIRIDGSTSPKSRQEQILTFQTDPTVRIALLGITAAGVAVTLTASSTVWFAELFWTPAIMVQAEDRCHRIGQQATVRCLYFVAKGTLDEVLWKLIEKKFRDLGEFVEGKENMGIALERELEDDEEDEILKVEEAPDEAESRKRKAENLFEDLLDTDDFELKAEIDELVHEEEEMLIVKGDDEDLDPDTADGRETPAPPSTAVNSSSNSDAKRIKPSNDAIILLDDDDDDEDRKAMTFSMAMQRIQDGTIQRFEPSVQCVSDNMNFRDIRYPAYKSLGLLMVSFGGRVCIKGYTTPQDEKYESLNRPQIGAIIIAVNEVVIPQNANFSKVLAYMRKLVMQGPLTLVFAEDKEFMPWFKEVMIPRFDAQLQARNQAKAQAQNSNAKKEVIDLLDD